MGVPSFGICKLSGIHQSTRRFRSFLLWAIKSFFFLFACTNNLLSEIPSNCLENYNMGIRESESQGV